MPKKPLHIISFDCPFPPEYGGIIDVFYKIKTLNELGFSIHLHCFVDKIPNQIEPLEKIVETLYIYKREYKFFKFFSIIPFSVLSRYSTELVSNINKIEAPILFEGLQTTFIIQKNLFSNRKKILRLMNLEDNYFKGLFKSEKILYKKWLYGLESIKYASYQKIMHKFDTVLTLSIYETAYVQSKFKNAVYVPVFHGNTKIAPLSSIGKYALYHGDLRMADNKRAVLFLIKIFAQIKDYPLVIASSKGRKFVENQIKSYDNISFVCLKNQKHLDDLFEETHINVMLSFQQSGTKLKCINSLFKSRYCIVNSNMVDDEQIRSLCTIASSETDFINAINQLKNKPFLEYEKRKLVLENVLNDHKNGMKISSILNE